ncbi:MFS transporter [Dyella mobilis]|uniref:MFS transporter n=1 Tax=Dyella mobilis TaxID=1849582 RepID=A0ABS2KCZ1_9GAMM|nr:MFS transporter [Dyella mobilis]MBM7128695.1 MFS transporter [Dyella mobilis]GLQ99020.1 MFS transporter [Dyella mobilis]
MDAGNDAIVVQLPVYRSSLHARRALRFVVMVGVVSLFADMTYEGARSINGQFLGLLGASGFWVSAIAGVGELTGYGLRLFTGYLADRTGRYWLITITGFAVNLLMVPLLALAGHWQVAGALIIGERIGKGIRTPARDAMLAHAGRSLGNGWAFGLHEALDQAGATIGPLLMAAVLFLRGSYHLAYACLLLPAAAGLVALLLARLAFPTPRDLERLPHVPVVDANRRFLLYLCGTSLVAAGFADYSLIAFHAHVSHVLPDIWIPPLYALGMVSAGASALMFGRWFDCYGVSALLGATALSSLFAPCVFLGNATWVAIGVVLWGIGVGAHESVMRAAVSRLVPAERRASAYGVFNTVFGVAWFLGSLALGWAYEHSLGFIVVLSMALQVLGVPLLLFARTPVLSTSIKEPQS